MVVPIIRDNHRGLCLIWVESSGQREHSYRSGNVTLKVVWQFWAFRPLTWNFAGAIIVLHLRLPSSEGATSKIPERKCNENRQISNNRRCGSGGGARSSGAGRGLGGAPQRGYGKRADEHGRHTPVADHGARQRHRGRQARYHEDGRGSYAAERHGQGRPAEGVGG